jgi:hypothetical protein
MPAKIPKIAPDCNTVVRSELLALLRGGNAHDTFNDIIDQIPSKLINAKGPRDHTPWRILEHMRITQWDILEFVRNPDHESPPYPEGYFPPDDKPATEQQWKESVKDFLKDRKDLEKIITDSSTDFFRPIPHARAYTIFREIVLAADHNAYNLGMLNLLVEHLREQRRGK